jgi:TfoX/Sxy family transcriptional regulator of competence genes
MNHPLVTPEQRFATIVEELLNNPDVTPPANGRGFGSSGLKVQHKIFAMLVRGNLVVKLPKARVDALVASGDGERYDPRHDGRVMKEWVVLAPTSKVEWLSLTREAMEFVASKY